MAHLVESMFYVGQTPWHGLGTSLSAPPTTEDAIVEAGLDWQVKQERLQLIDGTEAPAYANMRINNDGTRTILGITGLRYVPIQNYTAFRVIDPLVREQLVTLETAGSLSNGEIVWILARINAEVLGINNPNDIVRRYILLTNAHNGKQAVRFGYAGIRVVCNNTLTGAINSTQSQLIRIAHTANATTALTQLRESMNLINQSFEATEAQYRRMANTAINETDLSRYVVRVLGFDETNSLSTVAENQVLQIVTNYKYGRGADMTVGTVWGAYNAVTEYLSHQAGSSIEKRYKSLLFGTNQQRAQTAYNQAVLLAA